YANVSAGTGATAAIGFVTCSTVQQTSLGCPTASHVTIVGVPNASNLMVPFPASGTITNTDASTTATISARTAIPVNMQVGVMVAKFDTTTRCSINIRLNEITGFAVQNIGGIQDSGGVPDNTVVSLGSGTCILNDV